MPLPLPLAAPRPLAFGAGDGAIDGHADDEADADAAPLRAGDELRAAAECVRACRVAERVC
jgi:hypothetical protein